MKLAFCISLAVNSYNLTNKLMAKQILGFMLGVLLASVWWMIPVIGDIRYMFISVIATTIFCVGVAGWCDDNWNKS